MTALQKHCRYRQFDSPLGRLTLIAEDAFLRAILWPTQVTRIPLNALAARQDDALLNAAVDELMTYFRGASTTFRTPIAPLGTPFQQAVWQQLQQIPYGETRSYKSIALAIGRPTAVRAVGTAIGKNPISIMIPCHRVIASNGQLAGFAGGLAAKEVLLKTEGSWPYIKR